MIPIQNIEYHTNHNSQYLLIHKCGNTSVREALNYSDQEVVDYPIREKVRWTVIRDPVDRFVSGYIYDLNLNNFFDVSNNLESRIEEHIRINNIFNVYDYVNMRDRAKGRIPHTIPQVTYIMNQPIDHFIWFDDLSSFLELHAGYSVTLNRSIVDREHKDAVKNVLERHKQRIFDIHQIDYYYFERLQQQGLIWKWQNGKIFE